MSNDFPWSPKFFFFRSHREGFENNPQSQLIGWLWVKNHSPSTNATLSLVNPHELLVKPHVFCWWTHFLICWIRLSAGHIPEAWAFPCCGCEVNPSTVVTNVRAIVVIDPWLIIIAPYFSIKHGSFLHNMPTTADWIPILCGCITYRQPPLDACLGTSKT